MEDLGYCFTLILEPELCTLADTVETNVDAAQFEICLKQALSKWRTRPHNRWLWNVPIGQLPERDRESIKIAAYILMNRGDQ
jgi:hypothetical protein